MHPSIATSYILPAIFLNPVLFLHGVNTILSRLLPPIVIPTAAVQRPVYSMLGPAATHQHIDIQNSENLCWSYTAVMILAQLVAYDRVMRVREAGKERQRRKEEMNGTKGDAKHSDSYWDEGNNKPSNARKAGLMNGHAKEHSNSYWDEGNSKPSNARKVGFTNGHAKKFRKHDEPDCLTEEESDVIL